MKFCPECDNLLMSFNKKLYCKICAESFEINPDEKHEYMMIKTLKKDNPDGEPIIVERKSSESNVSNEYRKAYEDYFSQSPEL